MKKRTILAAASAIALAAGSFYYLRRDPADSLPPVMTREGESDDGGVIVRRRTIDYETVVRSALTQKASLITLTLAGDLIRDQNLETSIRFTPFPSSTARVRVKYHAEFVFGFPLEPGDFSVSRGAEGLVVRVRRPQLVAQPSVRLLSYAILDSGLLIDERTAVIELQERLQPEAERRGRRLAQRPGVSARSERVLRRFLQDVLDKAADPAADPPPRVVIRYR